MIARGGWFFGVGFSPLNFVCWLLWGGLFRSQTRHPCKGGRALEPNMLILAEPCLFTAQGSSSLSG